MKLINDAGGVILLIIGIGAALTMMFFPLIDALLTRPKVKKVSKLRLSKNRKDYRAICKILYCASPSLMSQGYKAGCNINKHDAPCKWCKKCKYGKAPIYEELCAVPIDENIERAIKAGASKKRENPYNAFVKTASGDIPYKVVFLCDQRKCDICSYPTCKHTFDIKHAKSFKLVGDVYEEKERESE